MHCPVSTHCLNALACPYCIGGSEYRPDGFKIVHPDKSDTKRWLYGDAPTLAAQARGKLAKKQGALAERRGARLTHGSVQIGSGRWDDHPNDIIWPNGWLIESRVRRGQFMHVVDQLTSTPLLWIDQQAQSILCVPFTLIQAFPFPEAPATLFWQQWNPRSQKLRGPWAISVKTGNRRGYTVLTRWAYDAREHPDAVQIWPEPHPSFIVLPDPQARQWLSAAFPQQQ